MDLQEVWARDQQSPSGIPKLQHPVQRAGPLRFCITSVIYCSQRGGGPSQYNWYNRTIRRVIGDWELLALHLGIGELGGGIQILTSPLTSLSSPRITNLRRYAEASGGHCPCPILPPLPCEPGIACPHENEPGLSLCDLECIILGTSVSRSAE